MFCPEVRPVRPTADNWFEGRGAYRDFVPEWYSTPESLAALLIVVLPQESVSTFVRLSRERRTDEPTR